MSDINHRLCPALLTPKIYEIYNLQQKTVVENAYKLAYSLVFKDNDMIWSTNSDVDPSAILRGGACSRPEGPRIEVEGPRAGVRLLERGQPAPSPPAIGSWGAM